MYVQSANDSIIKNPRAASPLEAANVTPFETATVEADAAAISAEAPAVAEVPDGTTDVAVVDRRRSAVTLDEEATTAVSAAIAALMVPVAL